MQVSDGSQELLMKLVAWECFGDTGIDPKRLLRAVPLSDLKAVSRNIKSNGAHLQSFACISMVELELLFKSGLLQGDWIYIRNGEHVSLTYEPVSFPQQTTAFELAGINTLEHMAPVGAMA